MTLYTEKVAYNSSIVFEDDLKLVRDNVCKYTNKQIEISRKR